MPNGNFRQQSQAPTVVILIAFNPCRLSRNHNQMKNMRDLLHVVFVRPPSANISGRPRLVLGKYASLLKRSKGLAIKANVPSSVSSDNLSIDY